MSNVREVVLETMRDNGLSGYEGRATPVIAALEQRDRDNAEALIQRGVSLGASEDTVRALMYEVGLLTRPVVVPEPEASNGHGKQGKVSKAQIMEAIENLTTLVTAQGERVTALEGVARRYGAR